MKFQWDSKKAKSNLSKIEDMSPEYRFDYKNAKPNRFVKKMKGKPVIVLLDEDVTKVFKTQAQVNNALRALILAMPKR